MGAIKEPLSVKSIMADNRKKAKIILSHLRKIYKSPGTALFFENPFQLLVATILSAQSTDTHVNKITKDLFRKYRTVSDFAGVPLDVLKKDLSSINFFNNKAKNIKASAKMIILEFGSRVPDSMQQLIKLPGIARKTANIILSNAYGINEGIAVDTHVKRLSFRLGLSLHNDPVKIEKDLMLLIPVNEWSDFSHLLILHGRNICQARKPAHGRCVLKDICPSAE